MNRTFLVSLALAGLHLTLAGCALPGPLRFSKNDFPKTGPKNPVVRILGLWQPSEGMWEGRTTRGFSGQVMFFGQSSDAPAEVNGEVMVYVFDDQGDPEEQVKPIHEFKYPADSWKALLGNGPLGASYSVFIPYTRPGLHEANCTLRVRYIPSSGHPFPVYSEMVNIPLTGAKTSKSASRDMDHQDPPEGWPKADAAPDAATPHELSGRMPPRARGFSEPIPIREDLQALLARKPKSVELTDADRQRILRNTRARLASGDDSRVSLIGYEESEPEQTVTRTGRSNRKTRNPLRSAEIAEDESADDRAAAEDESPTASSQARIIDDDEREEDPPAGQIQQRGRPKSRRTKFNLDSEHEHPKRHLLED